MKKIILAAASIAMACGIGFAAVGCGSDGDITVVSRTEGSGTRDAFMELIGLEDDQLFEDSSLQQETQNVITTVSGNEKAIGYISLGSLNSSVKAINVGGVEATEDNIKSGAYSMARPFNLVWTVDNSSLNAAQTALRDDFLAFIMSTEGQAVVSEEGYVTVSSEAYECSITEAATIRVSGSTSVAPLMSELVTAYVAAVQEAVSVTVTINVEQGGSGVGITDAQSGTSAFGMVSRELSDSEKSTFGEGTETIAQDGIAIVVNNANPCTNLTVDQIKGIYEGSIRNWSDVGVTFSEE